MCSRHFIPLYVAAFYSENKFPALALIKFQSTTRNRVFKGVFSKLTVYKGTCEIQVSSLHESLKVLYYLLLSLNRKLTNRYG